MHGHAVRDLAVTGIALQAKRIAVSKSTESSPERMQLHINKHTCQDNPAFQEDSTGDGVRLACGIRACTSIQSICT